MAIRDNRINVENLLDVLVELPQRDFEEVFSKARKKRKQGTDTQKVSAKEADLFHKLNNVFPPEKYSRYNELYTKFKSEELNVDENEELKKLSDEFEVLNARRLEYLGKLAAIRKQSLKDLINDLGIKP